MVVIAIHHLGLGRSIVYSGNRKYLIERLRWSLDSLLKLKNLNKIINKYLLVFISFCKLSISMFIFSMCDWRTEESEDSLINLFGSPCGFCLIKLLISLNFFVKNIVRYLTKLSCRQCQKNCKCIPS